MKTKTCEFEYRASPDSAEEGCREAPTRQMLLQQEYDEKAPDEVWLLCEEHAALLRHDLATGMVVGLTLVSDEAVAA